MDRGCLRLDDFSKFDNVEYRQCIFKPFVGEFMSTVCISDDSCHVILKGADKKTVSLTCRVSAKEFERKWNVKPRNLIRISDFGLRTTSEYGPLMLSLEDTTIITKEEKAQCTDTYPYEHNPSLCCAVVVLDSMWQQDEILYLNCTDGQRNRIVFSCEDLREGGVPRVQFFLNILKTQRFRAGQIVRMSNFTIASLPNGIVEFWLTEDSAISTFSNRTRATFRCTALTDPPTAHSKR
ncbi:hypothetical protein QR680_016715 [Steinernema hermaphroditum]|uniref:Uncharacterized protein n=1 Tax=Steinernema hermaphroditum TaxID=289476 RepID=A0AA39HCH6_9BILA|nr:hypothetical protein QR680_016715 [Steinernema hermaphroditum]